MPCSSQSEPIHLIYEKKALHLQRNQHKTLMLPLPKSEYLCPQYSVYNLFLLQCKGQKKRKKEKGWFPLTVNVFNWYTDVL